MAMLFMIDCNWLRPIGDPKKGVSIDTVCVAGNGVVVIKVVMELVVGSVFVALEHVSLAAIAIPSPITTVPALTICGWLESVEDEDDGSSSSLGAERSLLRDALLEGERDLGECVGEVE